MTIIRISHKKSLAIALVLLGSHQLYSGPLNLIKGAFSSTVSAAQNAVAFVSAAVPMNPFAKKTTSNNTENPSENITERANQQTVSLQPVIPNPIVQQPIVSPPHQSQPNNNQQIHHQPSPSTPYCPNFRSNLKEILTCVACRAYCSNCCTKCGDCCTSCGNSCGNCCSNCKHSCTETCICEHDKDCCFCGCQCGGWLIPLGCCCNCKDDNN